MVSKILAIDVLVVGLMVFSLGTRLTGHTVRFARVGGLALGALTFASFAGSMSHQATFHAPPDWAISLFLSGPNFVLGFVLGGIVGGVEDSFAATEPPMAPRVRQLSKATRLMWMVGLSIFAVGASLGIPEMFWRDEQMSARFGASIGPILSEIGAGAAVLSSGVPRDFGGVKF